MSRRPRVVVNTAIYLHGTSGSATATRQLVSALESDPSLDTTVTSPASRGGSHAVLNAMRDARWDLWAAPRSKPDVDLLVSPCNIGRRGPARKHLLVVYDTMVLDHPELFDRRFAAYFKLLVPLSVRSADLVVTLSPHTADRLRAMAPGRDVRVLRWPHGGASGGRAAWPKRPLVLMVGATEPVKNHVGGIAAVQQLRETTGVDIGLRLLGPAGRAESDVRAALLRVDPSQVWTSREVDVPGAVLAAAYASSWLLLQPSYDEGYGLPLLEAAAHALPVVHSGRGAMAGLLPSVDAGSTAAESLAAAMRPLLDGNCWREHSEAVLVRSAELGPEQFEEQLRAYVHELVGQ